MSSKKEDLLHTAEILFYQNGFHAVGLKRVVNESNIAMMTLYNHFASKDELVLEVLKRREDQYMNHLNFTVTTPTDSREGSEWIYVRIAEAHAYWITRNSNKGCMFLRAKEEYGEDPLHPIVQLVDAHKQQLKDFIQAADPSRSSSDILRLCLLLEGATALAETEDPQSAAEELIAMTEQLFIQSSGGRTTKPRRTDRSERQER